MNLIECVLLMQLNGCSILRSDMHVLMSDFELTLVCKVYSLFYDKIERSLLYVEKLSSLVGLSIFMVREAVDRRSDLSGSQALHRASQWTRKIVKG